MPNELSIIVDAVLNPASLSEIQNEIAKLSKGTKIDITADTSKAKKEVDDLKQKITNGKGQAKIVVDIDKGKSNANINTYLNSIKTKLQNSPIKLTFDVDKKATQNNIKNAVDNTQQQIQKATKDATKQATGKTGAAKPVVVPPRYVNDPDNYGRLQRTTTISSVSMDDAGNKIIEAHTAIDQMNRALGETVTVVSQLKESEEEEGKQWVEVSHTLTENFEKRAQEVDKINAYFAKQQNTYQDMFSSAFNQKNPLQGQFAEEATRALDAYKTKYEEIQKLTSQESRKATGQELQEILNLQNQANRIIQEQRSKQTQSISDQLQLTKALDEVTKLQQALDTLKSKAFERGNQLSGRYAEPVNEGIGSIQDSINSLRDNATTGNLASTLDTVKAIGDEIKKLDLERVRQQNQQYQARQLSATDITQQIPILKNDVTTLENKLKSMGFGSKFESQINDLRDLLKTLGQPGGATVQQYNSQMKQLKSDVTRYQGTVRGRADIASTGITNNQLQSIQGINKVLNAQANTEGIQKARQELSALADEYKKLQTQLQSGKLSNARLGVIDRETKELDQQLRTYQNLAKNLNGDASSKQWVADQETGIQKMKASFTEYQETISKTIQLTPQLQSQMNALSDTMNRSGAVDIANWKEVQTQFEQLKISVDQFKNSVQGQASALSINIETNKLQEVTGLLDKLNNTTVQSSGIASVRTELEALSTQYQEVVTQLQNPNLGEEEFKKLSDTVDELDKRFTTLSNRTSDSFLQKYQLDADNLSQRFEKLKQKYEDFVKVNPNGGNAELEASFERIQESINNINPDNISIVQKEVRNLGTEVSRVVGPSQTLGQVLRDSFGGLGGYLARFASGAAIIQKTISVIKSMVTEVKALDTSLVELQKVTGLTGDALSQFTDKAYQVGSSLGRTGQDVIDAVTTFSRAGYELKEATDLAQAALVMTNIGPDITSTESAASDMISIFKAYKIEAEDAMGVIDRLYNVANKEPLDFGNITQMLVTAGGTLAQTGTTLDQTMGLLTGAFATMRDESVSNGLLMISQRLRGLNEEGEALEASFIPKLGKAFGDVGIQIMDQNGELRSTYDILSDLAAKWDDLSSAQRQYLGEKAAGNRQVKTLNAIMQNWDVVVDTIQKAEEAGGAALEGNAKYMDSIEGRIVQFQSAFQDLARTTIDSNMVKGLVSFGTEIVKITTNIGGLQKVLIPVLALLAISKWNSIVKGVKALGNAFKTTAGSVSGFRIGLSAVVAALSIATSAWDSYIAKQKEARANDIETGRTAVENAASLSDAVARYDALASITNRTQAQEEEFKQAVEDVNSALGDKKTILDGLTAGTDNYTKALHKATQEENAQAKIEAQKAMNAARENVGQIRYGDNWLDTLTGMVVEPGVSMPTTQWNGLKEANDIYREFYDTLTKVGKIYHDDLTGVDKIIPKFDNVDSYVEFYYTLKDIQDQLVQMQIDTGNSSFVDNKLYDQASEFVSEYESAVNDYISATYNALSLGKPLETVNDYNAIADSMVNLTHATGLYEEAIRSYVEVQASAAGVNADIGDVGQSIEETGDAASETTNKLKELATELSSTTESYKTLTEAIAEQDKAGVISSETYQKLIEENEAYNEMLILTAEGYALNTEAVYDFIKAQGANQKLKALQEIKDRQDALEKLRTEQEELSKSWGNANAIADNQARQDQIQSEINGYAALIREIDAATGALARYNAAKSTKNQDENFNTGKQAYKDITEGLKTGKVGTDDFKSAIGFVLGENWEEELDRWGGSIEKARQEAEKLGKRYFGQEDERTGMANYRDDLVKAGYATYDKSTDQMEMLDKTADGTLTTFENIAKSLGTSVDAVVSMFGLMESYGAHFEFLEIVTDDDIKKAKELADTITETKEGGGEVNLSAVEQLQKARADMVQQLESYNKTLEIADPEGAAYQHAAEQAGQLEAAIASVDKALEGLNLGEKEKSLTFEDTVQQITDLKQAITDMQTAGLDIPVSLSGEVDKANALLDALGAEDGGKIVLTADSTNADSQITSIQTKLDAIKNDADIPVTVKAALESGSETAIQQLKEISSGKYKDETVNVVIDATDNASPKITTITETKYNDIELQANANDNATPEILGITAAEYDAYITIHAKREEYDKELEKIEKENQSGGSTEKTRSYSKERTGGDGGELRKKGRAARSTGQLALQEEVLVESNHPIPETVQVGGRPSVETPMVDQQPVTIPAEAEVESVDIEKVEDTPVEIPSATVVDTPSAAGSKTETVELQTKTENPDQVVEDAQNAADAEPVEVPVEAESPEEVPEQVQEAVDAAPPTEAEVKFAQDSIDQATQQVQDSAKSSPVEMNAETVMETVVDAGSSVKEMTSIAKDAGIATDEVENLNSAYKDLYAAADALDTAEPNTAEWDAAASDLQSAAQGFSSAYSALEVALGTLKPVTVNADTTPAIASINALANRTITIRANVTPSISQNAKGTNNAAEGISLVDEKGAELIEHTKQGTFELGTNKGPRFTQLEKGDVVHTATETKKILSRLSKVGGFFRNGLNQAKSIFSGGAFATGVSGGMSWNLINKTLKAVQNSNKKTTTTTKSTTTKKSTKKTKSVSAKSLQKYAEKLFDWAEIRLERLKTVTNTWLLNASEAIGYIAKNSELNNAIKSVEQEIENTTAAYNLYIKQAQTIADKAKLTDDIVQKIHDGEINIAEYDKNMQEKINQYTEWYDKALACVDALTDLREQEKELARQRLDNIIDHYTYRVNNLESIVSQREADLELMAKQGVEIEASEYGISIDATAKKLEELLSERTALENEFKTAISQGFIEEESAEWYDYSEKLAEVDRAITETKTALIELNDTAKNVSITNLSWQLDALTNSADNINDFVNLHTAQALDETAETYLKLIENGMDQIRNLEEQNERYREQQAGLDVLSEKYQDLQSNIESNNRAIMDMKVSQEEWNDAVLDLEINRLNKFKDTLTKTNDEYQRQKELQEALQNLEKARAQRTMRIYRGADQGFVYQADQEAVRSAQTELEDVIENQLLDRIDDLINAIEEQKNDTNVYDANGVLLGSAYSTPQLAAFSDILSNYYGDIGSTSPFASLKSNLYDQLTSNLGGNGSNALNFSVGTMNINEVDNASEFAETIIDQLPNALIQALNKK